MLMPKLQPLPIKTKNSTFFIKLCRLAGKNRQWQLLEDWYYVLPNKRTIIIPKGFIFDGSSYPWIIWLFFSPTGLLFIPAILHDFCFKYGYLWAVKGSNIYKLNPEYGFFKWCKLIRQVGIERNELMLVDYFVWSVSIIFGGYHWLANRKIIHDDLLPDDIS